MLLNWNDANAIVLHPVKKHLFQVVPKILLYAANQTLKRVSGYRICHLSVILSHFLVTLLTPVHHAHPVGHLAWNHFSCYATLGGVSERAEVWKEWHINCLCAYVFIQPQKHTRLHVNFHASLLRTSVAVRSQNHLSFTYMLSEARMACIHTLTSTFRLITAGRWGGGKGG